MDVDTLLARQMELHSSVRRPPKTAEQLMQLRDNMRDYRLFFEELRNLAKEIPSEVDTIFQCLMHISIGGAVNFDKQHQDESMPMHQAKVIARSSAIELEPAIREAIPHKELMVYVGLSKDLRTMLRVKVEDGNDLATAEKSVCEAVDYLDFIYGQAFGNPDKMFAFYMVEDPAALRSLLDGDDGSGATACSPLSMTSTSATLKGFAMVSSNSEPPSATPLPESLERLPELLAEHGAVVQNTKQQASDRIKAAHTILDWLAEVPLEVFLEKIDAIMQAVVEPLNVLAAEKRSTLCRVGCDAIIMLAQRLMDEPYMTEDAYSAEAPSVLGRALAMWTTTLTKRVFVTIAAISSSTDHALRELVICSHGHMTVVKAVLQALEHGTQTELRRRCLGYLALALVSARKMSKSRMREFSDLLVAPAQKFVQIGDSPSRKMARALCAVLREAAEKKFPIGDDKTEKLIAHEREQIVRVLDSPRELEHLFFETNAFASSMRGLSSSTSSLLHMPHGSAAHLHTRPKSPLPSSSLLSPPSRHPQPQPRPVSSRRKSNTASPAKRPLQLSPLMQQPDVFDTAVSLANKQPSSSSDMTPLWPHSARSGRLSIDTTGQKSHPLPSIGAEIHSLSSPHHSQGQTAVVGGAAPGTGSRLLPLSLIPPANASPMGPSISESALLAPHGLGKQRGSVGGARPGPQKISGSLRKKIEDGKYVAKQ